MSGVCVTPYLSRCLLGVLVSAVGSSSVCPGSCLSGVAWLCNLVLGGRVCAASRTRCTVEL